MTKCPHCGKEISSTEWFCPSCGAMLKPVHSIDFIAEPLPPLTTPSENHTDHTNTKTQTTDTTTPETKQQHTSKKLTTGMIVVIIVTCLLIALNFLPIITAVVSSSSSSSNNTSSSTTNSTSSNTSSSANSSNTNSASSSNSTNASNSTSNSASSNSTTNSTNTSNTNTSGSTNDAQTDLIDAEACQGPSDNTDPSLSADNNDQTYGYGFIISGISAIDGGDLSGTEGNGTWDNLMDCVVAKTSMPSSIESQMKSLIHTINTNTDAHQTILNAHWSLPDGSTIYVNYGGPVDTGGWYAHFSLKDPNTTSSSSTSNTPSNTSSPTNSSNEQSETSTSTGANGN